MKSILRLLTFALLLFVASPAMAQQTLLQGTITEGQQGAALTDAKIYLFQGTQLVAEAETNIDGTFVFQGFMGGSYEVVARFPGYDEARTTVMLTAGNALTLNATMQVRAGYSQQDRLRQHAPATPALAANRR